MVFWETPSLVFMGNSVAAFPFSYLSLSPGFFGLLIIFHVFSMRVCHISPGAPVEGPVWDESQNILRKMLVPGALHTMSGVFSDRQMDRKQPDGWNMTLRRGEERRGHVLSVSDGPFVSACVLQSSQICDF